MEVLVIVGSLFSSGRHSVQYCNVPGMSVVLRLRMNIYLFDSDNVRYYTSDIAISLSVVDCGCCSVYKW